MYWDYPDTFATQVAFWGNVANIAALFVAGVGFTFIIAIGLSIRVTLRESLHVQRDEALGRQLLSLGSTPGGSAQPIVSEILYLAQNEKYPRGYSDAELDAMAQRDRSSYEDYLAWISRLVVLFDTISSVRLWENAETRSAIALVLEKHAAAFRKDRLSGALRALMKRLTAHYSR